MPWGVNHYLSAEIVQCEYIILTTEQIIIICNNLFLWYASLHLVHCLNTYWIILNFKVTFMYLLGCWTWLHVSITLLIAEAVIRFEYLWQWTIFKAQVSHFTSTIAEINMNNRFKYAFTQAEWINNWSAQCKKCTSQ